MTIKDVKESTVFTGVVKVDQKSNLDVTATVVDGRIIPSIVAERGQEPHPLDIFNTEEIDMALELFVDHISSIMSRR